MLEVTIQVIHSASIPGLSVLGDKLGSVTVTRGAKLAEETPAAAEDEEEDGDDDDEDDQGLCVIKLRITVFETGEKLVAERSEAETQEAIKLKCKGCKVHSFKPLTCMLYVKATTTDLVFTLRHPVPSETVS